MVILVAVVGERDSSFLLVEVAMVIVLAGRVLLELIVVVAIITEVMLGLGVGDVVGGLVSVVVVDLPAALVVVVRVRLVVSASVKITLVDILVLLVIMVNGLGLAVV